MRKAMMMCALAFLPAGCGGDQEQAAAAPKFELQPIGYPEMVENHIKRDGCAFIPQNGGLGTLYISSGKDAFIKTGGKIVKLAADEASSKLPANAWQDYAGEGHAVSLAVTGDGRERETGKKDYSGKLTVHDASGAVVFEEAGMAECGT